jgi:hypothetical protein
MQSPPLLVTIFHYSIPEGMLGRGLNKYQGFAGDGEQRPLVPRGAPRQRKPYPRESGWESEACPKGQPPSRSRHWQKGPAHGGKAGGGEQAQTAQTCKTGMAWGHRHGWKPRAQSVPTRPIDRAPADDGCPGVGRERGPIHLRGQDRGSRTLTTARPGHRPQARTSGRSQARDGLRGASPRAPELPEEAADGNAVDTGSGVPAAHRRRAAGFLMARTARDARGGEPKRPVQVSTTEAPPKAEERGKLASRMRRKCPAQFGGGLGEKAARTSLVAYPTPLPGAPDARRSAHFAWGQTLTPNPRLDSVHP